MDEGRVALAELLTLIKIWVIRLKFPIIVRLQGLNAGYSQRELIDELGLDVESAVEISEGS